MPTPSTKGGEYISSYYNSPGFVRRLNNRQTYMSLPQNTIVKRNPLQINGYHMAKPTEDQQNAYYSKNGYIVLGNDMDNIDKSIVPNVGSAVAHEGGHGLERSLSLINSSNFQDVKGSYTDYIPVLRKSKAYQRYVDKLKKVTSPSVLNKQLSSPSLYWNNASEAHDAMPGESYGDLNALRYDLYNNGIYDSRERDTPFTKQMLEQYKKKAMKGEKSRIFRNFSDDDIIFMINNVAQNDNKRHLDETNYLA